MADRPFDRTVINPRERALSSDVNQSESQLDASLRLALQHLLARQAGFGTGFFGAAYRVTQTSPTGMSVLVAPGLGLLNDPSDLPAAIGGVVGVDDLQPVKPLVLANNVTFAVPAAPAGPNTRIDIIEIKADRRLENPSSRLIFDAGTEAFVAGSVNKTLAFAHDGRTGTVNAPANSTVGLSYKVGVAANPGVAPAVSPGYVKVADINVGSGVVTILNNAVVDRRAYLGANGIVNAGLRYRVRWNGGVPLFDVLSLIAPAGVSIVVGTTGGGVRSQSRVYVIAGELANATFVAQIKPNVAPVAAEFIAMQSSFYGGVTVGSPIVTVDAALQGQIATAGGSVAVGQKIATVDLAGVYQTAGTTNVTNVLLEDVEYLMSFALSY